MPPDPDPITASTMTRTPRRAGPLEKTAWVVGGALVATYASAQLWLSQTNDAAIDAFQQARAFGAPASERKPTARVLRFEAPDQSAWSAARVAAFIEQASQPTLPRAVLRIDSLDLEVPIYEGASEWNLNRGAAWIEGTAPLGADGNAGLAAHRDGYFRALQDIRLADRIQLETFEGRSTYRVTGIEIVAPSAVGVLAATAEPALTLVTCYPFYHVGPAPQRFIVRAERVTPSSGVMRTALAR